MAGHNSRTWRRRLLSSAPKAPEARVGCRRQRAASAAASVATLVNSVASPARPHPAHAAARTNRLVSRRDWLAIKLGKSEHDPQALALWSARRCMGVPPGARESGLVI